MHRVIVIGSVNHDRIWQLDDALIPGGRLRFSTRLVHLGGGGFHTGSQLLDLGAKVVLVSRLMQDEHGLSALNVLNEAGFDTAQISMLPGETMPLEILLEPNGERTIIAPSGARALPHAARGALKGNAAYINAFQLDETLIAELNKVPVVISQLPIRPATPRPADYVIASRADASEEIETIWQRAANLAGPRLKMLVLTDGPRPISLFDGHMLVKVDAAPAVRVASTIGAGDRFSGAFLFALLEGQDAAGAASLASRQTADWLRQREGM